MNLRRESCFSNLADMLHAHSKKGRLVYSPNPGNWGDALIAEGTRQFFADKHIHVSEFSFMAMRKWSKYKIALKSRSLNPILVYGGGGAFVDFYQRVDQLKTVSPLFTKCIFMPSTFGVSLDGIEFQTPPLFYRRDESESKLIMPESHFCHDMAFYIQPPEVEVTQKTGYFFRVDKEAPDDFRVPSGNRDISGEGKETNPVLSFFEAVGAFEAVFTNRLHVAIAASLMDREVHFFSNSYFKNRAIFQSSIEPFFPRTVFHSTTPQAFGL